MEFKNYFDKIVEEFSSGKYRSEIEKAKQEFFNISGTVHEEDREYVDRINLFLDWYVFERMLDEEDMTPLNMYFHLHQTEMDEQERMVMNGMMSSSTGLFIVKKLRSDSVKVKDMFTDKTFNVEDDYFLSFAHKGDIFQGRIIPLKGKNTFGIGFCFHAPETETYIRSEIKKIKNMERNYHVNLMMRLALMKIKTEEYPHVGIKDIYSKEPRIRF